MTKTGKWIVLRRINSYLVIYREYCLNLMLNVKLFGAEFIIIALSTSKLSFTGFIHKLT